MDKEVDNTIEAIRIFEEKIKRGLEFKYRNQGYKSDYIRFELETNIDLQKFASLYLEKNIYPKERFSRAISYLMDIKIQSMFLGIDIAQYNALIYNHYQEGFDIKSNPRLLLLHLYLDQNVIIKSRIIWERLMNFVYFLETGIELEDKVKKSKRSLFWDYIKNNSNKWNFLRRYQSFVNDFDDYFRTPEVHKSSKLRSLFIKNEVPDADILLGTHNILLNIWETTYRIISGNEVDSEFWTIAMDKMQVTKNKRKF